MAKATKKAESPAQLKKKLAELEKENAQLKKSKNNKDSSNKSKLAWFKSLVSFTMMFISAAMLIAGIELIWIQRTVLNTDTWVDKTSSVIQTEAVRNDIADKITTELFTQIDVDAYVKEALPEKAQPLSGPIASGIEGFANDKTKEILASEKFLEVWARANRASHSAIINSIESLDTIDKENNSSNILFLIDDKLMLNLRPVLDEVKADLVSRGVTFLPEEQKIPAERVTFEVAQIENLPAILATYNFINSMSFLLPILAVLFAGVGIALANKKRNALLTLIVLTVLFAVVSVQLIKVGQYGLAQGVAQNAKSLSVESSTAIYSILTSDLVTSLRWAMSVMLIFAAAVLLTGPSRFANWFRSKVGGLFKNYKKNKFVNWIATNAYGVITALGLIVTAVIVLGPFTSPQPIAWLVGIAGVLAVLIIAIKQELDK